jgi:uncharacterized protein (TIGR02300 family)
MPAKDLGTKHHCWKCGTKFYDLKKPAAICPKCGTNAREAPTTRAPAVADKRKAKEKEKAKVVADPVEAVEEPELEEELDEALDDEPDEPEDDT